MGTKPSIAWKAFKSFSIKNKQLTETSSIGIEIIQRSDCDKILWLSYMIRFEGYEYGWSSGCLFSIASPDNLLDISSSNWWWPENEPFEKWCISVETMDLFKKCVQMNHWKWEGFSE